jgi:hypothetical protein
MRWCVQRSSDADSAAALVRLAWPRFLVTRSSAGRNCSYPRARFVAWHAPVRCTRTRVKSRSNVFRTRCGNELSGDAFAHQGADCRTNPLLRGWLRPCSLSGGRRPALRRASSDPALTEVRKAQTVIASSRTSNSRVAERGWFVASHSSCALSGREASGSSPWRSRKIKTLTRSLQSRQRHVGSSNRA